MTGIAEPGKPGQWLVYPWPADATFSDVVRHFVMQQPWMNATTQQHLAYWEGYRLALEAARPDQIRYAGQARWTDDMRDCVRRCVLAYRHKRAAELHGTTVKASTLRAA